MQYWQGPNGLSKNNGNAYCTWSSTDLPLATLQSYTCAPGGNAKNASSCPAGGPFTDCISVDTINACPINLGADAPANSHLGGPWVNALYSIY